LRRRVDASAEIDALFEPELPEWRDDCSAPIDDRLRSWEDWMATYYRPLKLARAKYEEATGAVFWEPIPMPDMPFDPRQI
jgi:hypothetical protein